MDLDHHCLICQQLTELFINKKASNDEYFIFFCFKSFLGFKISGDQNQRGYFLQYTLFCFSVQTVLYIFLRWSFSLCSRIYSHNWQRTDILCLWNVRSDRHLDMGSLFICHKFYAVFSANCAVIPNNVRVSQIDGYILNMLYDQCR